MIIGRVDNSAGCMDIHGDAQFDALLSSLGLRHDSAISGTQNVRDFSQQTPGCSTSDSSVQVTPRDLHTTTTTWGQAHSNHKLSMSEIKTVDILPSNQGTIEATPTNSSQLHWNSVATCNSIGMTSQHSECPKVTTTSAMPQLISSGNEVPFSLEHIPDPSSMQGNENNLTEHDIKQEIYSDTELEFGNSTAKYNTRHRVPTRRKKCDKIRGKSFKKKLADGNAEWQADDRSELKIDEVKREVAELSEWEMNAGNNTSHDIKDKLYPEGNIMKLRKKNKKPTDSKKSTKR